MALVLIFVPRLNGSSFGLELLLALGSFATAYTVVMLYLGRRRLLRFQVTAAGLGSNVLATDWAVAPTLSRLLRCTPSGGTLNLVRKELQLLWPLAPLTLIAFGILLAVVPLRLASSSQDWSVTVGISIVLIHGALAAILAGALSLGEERSVGLHTWNLTQPVSVLRQWAIKLVTAVFASVTCSGAVALIAHLLFGPDFLQQIAAMFYGSRGLLPLALFPLLTFVAFWCATAVKGTVRAAFWCVPAAAVVLAAYDFGMSAGMSNSAVEVVRTLTEAVHPFPFSSEFEVMASKLLWSQRSVVVPALWVAVWLLPLAAIQSRQRFRSEIREGIRPLIRQVLFLAAIASLSGLLQIVPAAATGTMHNNTVRVLMEISRGVAAMHLAPSAVSEAGFTASLETISNSVALSERTRSWFATDAVVIRPKSAVARDSGYELMKETRYMITAELHGGWKCAFADNLFDDRYGVGAMGIPRGANYLFLCLSREGKLGWLQAIP
jgi:hypothetical protein